MVEEILFFLLELLFNIEIWVYGFFLYFVCKILYDVVLGFFKCVKFFNVLIFFKFLVLIIFFLFKVKNLGWIFVVINLFFLNVVSIWV